MNGVQFNPYRNDEREYNRKKSNAEALLLHLMETGKVKAGSEEWKKRSDYIEYCNTMASHLNDNYNEND